MNNGLSLEKHRRQYAMDIRPSHRSAPSSTMTMIMVKSKLDATVPIVIILMTIYWLVDDYISTCTVYFLEARQGKAHPE
jgi:hypothetical protein